MEDIEALLARLRDGQYQSRGEAALQLAADADGLELLLDVARRIPEENPTDYEFVHAVFGGIESVASLHEERRGEFVAIFVNAFRRGKSSIAAVGLAKIAPETALAEFVAALKRPPDERDDYAIARGLEQLAADPGVQRRTIEPLSELLFSDGWFVPSTAASALELVDDDRAFELLLRTVARENRQADASRPVSQLLGSPRAAGRVDDIAELLCSLATGDERERDNIAQALNSGAGPDWLRALLTQAATSTPGSVDDPAVVPELLTLLIEGTDALWVAWALRKIGDPINVPALCFIVDHHSGDACKNATHALALECPNGVRALIKRIDAPNKETRSNVLGALRDPGADWRDFRDDKKEAEQHRKDVINVLYAELDSPREDERVLAIRALAALGARARPKLLNKQLSDPSAAVRLAAANSVGALAGWHPTSELRRSLTDEIPQIRAAAARALAPAGKRVRAAELVGLLHDESAEVRLAAAEVVDAGSAKRAAALTDCLNDPIGRVRSAAVRALASAGPRMLSRLGELLHSDDRDIQEAAAIGIAGYGSAGIATLGEAAASANPGVRAAAATGVATVADADHPDASAIVEGLLDDEEPRVRWAVLTALPTTAVNLLARLDLMLHNGDGEERVAAAVAIARLHPAIGDPRRDDGASIEDRTRAKQFGEDVAARLSSALRDSNRDVVRATATAIARVLNALDPSRDRFPAWFQVTRDHYILRVSRQARAVLEALKDAAARDGRTADTVAAAFAAIHQALTTKRASGLIDERTAYFEAPSREPDDALLESLAQAAVDPTQPATRHVDATFYRRGETRIANGSALQQGHSYDLEVAIREAPTGIPVIGQRPAVAKPEPEAEAVDIVVVVEAEGGLVVDEPKIARIRLPRSGDSTKNAWFPIRAVSETPHADKLAEVRIQLFYRLNLLASAVIRAEVVSEYHASERSPLGLERPIVLEHDRIERGFVNLAGEEARSLHIDVRRRDEQFVLEFTWQDSTGRIFSVPAPLALTAGELSEQFNNVRMELLAVTMGDAYVGKVDGTSYEYRVAMRRLAEAGRQLHTALFRREPYTALAEIDRLLDSMPPEPGSIIAISVASEQAAEFLFPWAMLYDMPLPTKDGKMPDPEGFWGFRYCIEQRLHLKWRPPKPAAQSTSSAPIRMAFMLWDKFPNAAEHRTMIEKLAEERPGTLKVSRPPIDRKSSALTALRNDRDDIVYFYAHAHIRQRVNALEAFLSALRDLEEEELEDRPESALSRATLKRVINRALAAAPDPSWIKLSNGRLKLSDDLYEDRALDLDNGPLVIVNACESSQLTTSLRGESFVHFFLSRGATAFLGTECTMTVSFAHPFAKTVLNEVLGGASIGAAVLSARRQFVEQQNPLGLAYSLYGNAAWKIRTVTNSTGADM